MSGECCKIPSLSWQSFIAHGFLVHGCPKFWHNLYLSTMYIYRPFMSVELSKQEAQLSPRDRAMRRVS